MTTETPPEPPDGGAGEQESAVSVAKGNLASADLTNVDWEKAQSEPEFRELVRRLRNFIFPVTVAFLVWYLLYVVLSVYATGFMATKIGGNITVGLVFGLLQFVSTWAITAWYVSFAGKRIDPLATTIRDEIGGDK